MSVERDTHTQLIQTAHTNTHTRTHTQSLTTGLQCHMNQAVEVFLGVRPYLGLLIEEGVKRVGSDTFEWCALLA